MDLVVDSKSNSDQPDRIVVLGRDSEDYILKHGEDYRKLILSALEFLALDLSAIPGVDFKSEDVDTYIEGVLSRAR